MEALAMQSFPHLVLLALRSAFVPIESLSIAMICWFQNNPPIARAIIGCNEDGRNE
jgi:hypothetical protein